MQGLERPFKAGTIAFEPADDDDARQVQFSGLGPELLGLHFDAGDGIDDNEGALDDAQRGAGITEKVGESRRIDDVDFGLLPFGVGEAGGEGVAAGDFLVVEVGHGGAVVHLAHAVDGAGDEEHG